jgi:hypothetical protein
MSRARKIVFVITLIGAAYLIATPFALSLFSRTRDAQHLSDYYRPYMSDTDIHNIKHNLATVNAGGTELFTVMLPTLKRDLGLSDAEFTAYVTENYPHVAKFLVRVPMVVKYLNPALQQVLRQPDNFHDADEFPLANLDVRVGPWALLALGLGLGVVAVFLARTDDKNALPVIAVTLVGLGLLVGPAVLGWFHETESAEKAAEAARGPFSPVVANTTISDTFSFDAAFTEMQDAMFPAIGGKLGKTPAQFDEQLHASFPATMKLLDEWDRSIYKGSVRLSLSQMRYMDEFHNADATPYTALPWIFMVPGALLLVGGVIGLVAWRRSWNAAP